MSSGGRSRAAALALLLGVIAVLGAAVIVPTALHWAKTGAVIKETRLSSQRAEQRSQASETLETTKSDWSTFAADERGGFVLAGTDDEGIAKAKARINELFAKFGGRLTTPISGEAGDGPREGVRILQVEVSGVLPRKNLATLLTALESEPAYLVISAFNARKRSSEQLSIRFTAAAFRLLEPEV